VNNIVNNILNSGYTILENIFTNSECCEYKNILNDIHENYELSEEGREKTETFNNKGVKIIYNLHNKHLNFIKLIDHHKYIDIVEALLKKGSYQDSEKFVLNQIMARSPTSVSAKQQLHIDSNIPGCHVPLAIQVLIALDDFTIENGATKIIPFSHKRHSFAENGLSYKDEISVCVPKGTVVIFDAGLWHGGGEKKQEGDRWAIILQYNRWFIKPTYDFSKNMPTKIFNSLSDRQKDIFGYKCNPPKDEFTRISRQSIDFEIPEPYSLPILGKNVILK